MSDLAFKQKMTKKAFEGKLIKEFGHANLSKEIVKETDWENSEPDFYIATISVYCYYIKGVHIATWCKGSGWIFKHAYDADAMQKRVDEMAEIDRQLGIA
jgi:hypothetical protein